MKVSRPTIVRAYDYANRDEAAAAARDGRKPTRPPHRWSDEARQAKQKPPTKKTVAPVGTKINV